MSPSLAGGLYWVGLSMFLRHAARAVGVLVLAAVLSPTDFGMYAALFLFIDGLSMIQGFGLGHALIVDRSGDSASTDTAFFLSLMIALVLFLAGLAGSRLVEDLSRMPGIADPFAVCCFLIIIQALRIVPARLFERELDFRKTFLPTVASSLGFLLVAIPLAFRGYGVWSLVFGQLASVGAETITVWLLSSYRPRLRFRIDYARKHLVFGWAVLGGTLLHYLIRSVDRFALSRGPGAEELGTYAFAFSLATLPSMFFVRIVNTVLFPNYAAETDQGKRNELFFGATRITTGLSFCFLVIAIFSAGPLLTLVYGAKWDAAAWPVAILALAALLRTQNSMLCDLFIGSGRPALFRWLNFVQLAAAVVAILMLPTRSAITIAGAMAIAGFAALLFGVGVSSSMELNRLDYLKCWRSPVLAGAGAALVWIAMPGPGIEAGWIATLAPLVLGGGAFLAIWLASDRPSRAVLTRYAARYVQRSENAR